MHIAAVVEHENANLPAAMRRSDRSIPVDLSMYRNDSDVYMTTDWGTPIQDQLSLKFGTRGPTALEDFMFRQKLQRFDHERVSRLIFIIRRQQV
jgi:hypothetical protein